MTMRMGCTLWCGNQNDMYLHLNWGTWIPETKEVIPYILLFELANTAHCTVYNLRDAYITTSIEMPAKAAAHLASPAPPTIWHSTSMHLH